MSVKEFKVLMSAKFLSEDRVEFSARYFSQIVAIFDSHIFPHHHPQKEVETIETINIIFSLLNSGLLKVSIIILYNPVVDFYLPMLMFVDEYFDNGRPKISSKFINY